MNINLIEITDKFFIVHKQYVSVIISFKIFYFFFIAL